MKAITIRTTRDRAEHLRRACHYMFTAHDAAYRTHGGLTEHAHLQCREEMGLIIADIEKALNEGESER